MSEWQRAVATGGRRDDAEPEIIRVFHEAGWAVWPLSGRGVPDLLVAPPGGHCILVECKSGKAKLNADQEKWHAAWKGRRPEIVRTAAHARKLVRMHDGAPVNWMDEVEG